jgi:hypothetical protein
MPRHHPREEGVLLRRAAPVDVGTALEAVGPATRHARPDEESVQGLSPVFRCRELVYRKRNRSPRFVSVQQPL